MVDGSDLELEVFFFSTFEQFSTLLFKRTTMMTMMADNTFDVLQSAKEKEMCACNSKDNLDRV
jgi:hypothetical protein